MIIRPPPSLPSRLLKPSTFLHHPRLSNNNLQTRSFILPTTSSTPQRLTVTRNLRHPPSKLFTLISDINSYSSFVPFCVKSTVTSTTPPPDSFPTTADLRVGWGGYDETFTSKVKCERFDEGKGGVVMADASENGIFEVLRATWVVNEKDKDVVLNVEKVKKEMEESKVDLEIEYKFANPLYAVMSEAVVPVVAGKIIEAFEGRVEQVLGKR
ncbi:hypothetical protein TWF506_009977 [Arthrobotrys conoides]|uniref:Coenzyme Q-binding protein COQ10 START domain-containing protein n=1 Tax=Arthrobotrys conoides TaxID=74498 RepID=A0AAN8NKM3_9PEZI